MQEQNNFDEVLGSIQERLHKSLYAYVPFFYLAFFFFNFILFHVDVNIHKEDLVKLGYKEKILKRILLRNIQD